MTSELGRVIPFDRGPIQGPPPPWEHSRALTMGGTPAWSHEVDGSGGRPWYSDAERDAFHDHRAAWLAHHKRVEKAARKAKRATLVHPLWAERQRACAVHVLMDPTRYGLGTKPAKGRPPKRSRWERQTMPCYARCVAWDVTDPRAVGYLYGACARHLLQALDDDSSRTWRWADERIVVREEAEDECALAVLGGQPDMMRAMDTGWNHPRG